VAAYKKQHYLPAAYLKQFSADGIQATRKSKVCRTDAKRCLFVPVESQCAEDYHYSKSSAETVEKFFKSGEDLYAHIAKVARERKVPTTHDYFGLILMMFDLHLRSISYRNRTDQENYQAYLLRLAYLRAEVLTGKKGEIVSDAESMEHLTNFWRVRLLEAPADSELVTSDSPSIWCNWDIVDQPHCVIMPVLPQFCAVAYDERFSRVDGNLTERDTAKLNVWQVRHCEECIFSLSMPTAQQVSVFQGHMMNRSPRENYTDSKSWNMHRVTLDGEVPFSFLSKVSS
jgi:hypothetical protein